MKSIPVGDVLKAVASVSQSVGQDLLPLFQNHIPALRTGALPDAEGAMLEAREEAKARVDDEPTQSNR